LEVASTELALSDLQVLERRLTKYRKALKSGDKEAEAHLAVLERFQGLLDSGNPCAGLSLRELSWLAEEGFLTVRPSLVVANIGEEMVGSPDASLNGLQEQAERCGLDVVQMCVQLEWELGQLSETEAREFKQEIGLTEDGAACLLRATNKLLDLVTFYTIVGGNEVRAWTLPRGTPAGEAAGKVHSDMARGFIRAEVVTYDELMSAGSLASARARGVVASEGRDYPVQDGDVITFRFQR